MIFAAFGAVACAFGLSACDNGSGNDNPSGGNPGGSTGGDGHTHVMEHHGMEDATCDKNGNVEYYSCSECGKNFADEEGNKELSDVIIYSEGHKMEFVKEYHESCTEAGILEHWHCFNCDKYFADEEGKTELSDVTAPAVGHKPVFVGGTPVSCTQDGEVEHYNCSVCGKNFSDEECENELENIKIVSDGHNMSYTEETQASCNAGGNIAYYYCSVCEKYFSDFEGFIELNEEEIFTEATGHEIGRNLEHREGYGANCFSDGRVEHYYCWECEKFYLDEACKTEVSEEDLKVPSEGHSMEWVPEQPAGCEENGVEAHWYCPVCELCFADEEGEQLVESWELSIAPTGHRFDETKWEHNDNHHWHEVTLCGHTGLQSGYADHDFEGKFCKICSYELTVPLEKDRTFIQDGLIYEWASDGYSLSGVDGDKTAKTSVIIPEEVNGFAVKYINDRAFEGCTAINSVSVPSLEFWNEATGGGTAVSTGGFGRIPSQYTMYIDGALLENMVIPEGMERIGDYSNCNSLKTVVFSSGANYSDDDNRYKFTNCANLEKLTLSADYEASEKLWNVCYLFGANGKGVPASLKTVEITDGDKIENYFFQYLSGVENIILPDGIAEIGDYAFKGCAALKSISLPDRVAKIGSEAFNGCAALAALEVPAGVTEIGEGAFIGCDTLESLSLPVVFTSFINLFEKTFSGGGMPVALKEVTLTGALPIPDNAFKNFDKLESVNIGNGIASIGASAFAGCSSLSDITFGSGIESFGESAFEGCAFTSFTIPEKIKTIESKTFYGCSSLATVDFGLVETVKSDAFANCAFVELEIPETVKYIGDSAFYCATLHKVNTPSLDAWLNIQFESHQANPVAQLHELYVGGTLLTDIVFTTEQTEVNDYAFMECTSITSVTFPAGFERIGQLAFFNCTSLNAVYASTLESWCAIEMGDNFILNGDGRLYIGGALVEELVVPGSISVVKNFQGCDSIKSVVVKEGANAVDDYAFAYCKSLESVVIEKGVEVIGVDAFCYCEKLKSVTTFGGLKEVKSGALSHCSSLTTVDFGADLEAIESDVFSQSTLENLSMPVIDGRIRTGVPATLKNLTVTGGTEIASFALPFPSLQTVVIPDSVTKIGKNVFGNRSNLVSIKLPFVGPGPNDTS